MFSIPPALLGGICLGLSSAVVLAQTGGVLGISGIIGGLLTGRGRQQGWRWAFGAGLLAGAGLASQLHPTSFTAPAATFTLARAAAGGALVGAGSALGNGCTSGHGICGISRLSPRSIAFIAVAMAAGAAAATLSGAAAAIPAPAAVPPPGRLLRLMTSGVSALVTPPAAARKLLGGSGISGRAEARLAAAVYGGAGCVFALGLSISGMTSAGNVVAFLSPASPAFDPSLMLVMAGAIGAAIIPFQTAAGWHRARKAGLVSQARPKPPGGAVDGRLLAGAALFGAGWGLTGLCPGPALANLARPSPQITVAIGAMLGGMWAVQRCG